MTLTNLLQLLVGGMAMGAIYTLTAKGLFITHLTTERMNFGQGDFLMAAAFLSLAALGAGLPLLAAVAAVVLVLALMGWGLERFAVRPLDRLALPGQNPGIDQHFQCLIPGRNRANP